MDGKGYGPQFDNRNTQRTQFWHARKFRDSTSVLKGGMCEDINSGYFAGAFMGKKFKGNPSAEEFEKSLEYLLDDLSTSSGCDQSDLSISNSVNSLDTVIARDCGTPDSAVSSIRDGFMIDVTITENHRKNRRPRSDIFEFIQGPAQGQRYLDHCMNKTKSLCDVSHRTSHITPRGDAKQYEMEFESMLDELHSTIEDLDTFSRDNIGVSLESLDSVSSVSKSGRVSPISTTSETTSYSYSAGELKISESAMSTDSIATTNSSLADSKMIEKALVHQGESTGTHSVINGYSASATTPAYKVPQLKHHNSDILCTFDIMDHTKPERSSADIGVDSKIAHTINARFSPKPQHKVLTCLDDADKHCCKSDIRTKPDKLSEEDFNFIPANTKNIDSTQCTDICTTKPNVHVNRCEKFASDSYCNENPYKPGTVIAHIKPLPRENASCSAKELQPMVSNNTCLGKRAPESDKPPSIDIQKYTIKSHHNSHNAGSPPAHYSEYDPSGSIMSSVTDLSGVASEIGYIADMDESIFSGTPNYEAPWLDEAIQNNMESEMGDCFVQKGFRPLNFVGLESKYMIAPLKGTELRIPTPVKLRKETGTQTCNEPMIHPASDYPGLKRLSDKDRQAAGSNSSVCTSTQTDNTQYSCGGSCNKNLHYTGRDMQRAIVCNMEGKSHNIPYCSSVEISPLLNGSLSSGYCRLARANSLDTGLSSEKKLCITASTNNNTIKSASNLSDTHRAMIVETDKTGTSCGREGGSSKGDIKSNHLEVQSEHFHSLRGQRDAASVKQPEFVVTVHSPPPEKLNSGKSVVSEVEQITGNHKETTAEKTFLSTGNCCNIGSASIKSESVPNISYERKTTQRQETLRRYASVLIISNINKHLHQAEVVKASAVTKRSSYDRDVTCTQPVQLRPRQSADAKSQQGMPGNLIAGVNGSKGVNSRLMSHDNHKQMLSYTF